MLKVRIDKKNRNMRRLVEMNKMAKIGLIFSFIAMLWLIMPCEGHCNFTNPLINTEHSCCQPSSSQRIPTKSANDGLNQICKSIYVGYTIPSVVKAPLPQIVNSQPTVAILNTVQNLDNTRQEHFWNYHSPPLENSSQVQARTLYTPHAPPAIS